MKKIAPYNKSCPVCKNPCAFEGFNHIQCPNDSCSNYSESQKNCVTEWKREQLEFNNSYASPINSECLDDEEEQHEEIAKSLRRLYQGYYNVPTTTGTGISHSSTQDTSIDNCSVSKPQDYYDDDDYLFNSTAVDDDFDVY